MINKRKIVLIGTGFVGMSMAYSLLNQGGVNELVLIDIDKNKAQGEAMDLSHGVPCSPCKMNIKSGDYCDCKDADIVVITAGMNQKPNQTRLELVQTNAKIMRDITKDVVDSGFGGIFIIASNPVDIMTYVVQKVSGFPKERVIGSGTALDTARLRFLVGEYLNVSSKNVHAYIMGEHGDSSFVSWENAYVGCKKIIDIMKDNNLPLSDLEDIHKSVVNAAYEIIDKKKATYYGIGVALVKIIKAILNDENEIMTISTYQNGEYGQKGLYIGVPAVIGGSGVRKILRLKLEDSEQEKFDNSCSIIKDTISQIEELL